ncbi:PfaD family polyunsaturated fatty acid/polyketide biosynthesis protein [Saccharothrix longispora]|uniref:PfaD family protein n=1 Tax=Saccharothrix longispora TaxID=33920 RepID=A0ABU1PW19_9PSEU|nr:PfaD family polyunsaturated fatty acid/polyketide biosynthesis protein [Saccharothrix longispora]MDR6594493.1 PfaD family protein [Saccharothrix longispora]
MTAVVVDDAVRHDPEGIRRVLEALDRPCFIVRTGRGIGASTRYPATPGLSLLASAPAVPPERLGDSGFARHHGTRFPLMAGSMAHGIASVALVTAMARAGFLASYGAAAVPLRDVGAAVARLAREIPGLPFAVNFIHDGRDERGMVELIRCLTRHRVRCLEVSGNMLISKEVLHYRLSGITEDRSGAVVPANRLIAKVAHPDIALRFLRPVDRAQVDELVAEGRLTADEARLAERLPLADDITVEADSGGHTDGRPLAVLFPAIVALRDQVQRQHRYAAPVRIGAAGGIGTPHAALAAFALGAAYVVTGSINQACVEAGTSDAARRMLAAAGITDFESAPSPVAFEAGTTVQVLRAASRFPVHARRLHQLYEHHDGLDALPAQERDRLERVFRYDLDEVWRQAVEHKMTTDPAAVTRATADPKRAMAMVFRWYLAMSSRWAVAGEPDREADYQIWCGPAMGAFNDWVRGSHLEQWSNRRVAEVNRHLLRGAAHLARLNQLTLAGVRLPQEWTRYRIERENTP